MKDAFITLVGTFMFLTLATILLCTVIIILQSIFNKEARNDWRYVIRMARKYIQSVIYCSITKMVSLLLKLVEMMDNRKVKDRA